MDFLNKCFDALKHGALMLSISALIFFVLERLFRHRKAAKPWRATLLDAQFAFISLLYPPFIYFFLSAFFGYEVTQHTEHHRLTMLSFGGPFLAVLLARDCLIYIRHRLFHTSKLWPFHSIHHSSEELNWLSALRFHPAENLIEVAGDLAVFGFSDFAGADPVVLSAAALFIGFWDCFIHSNQRWTYGPLRYVLVSPVQHRWHHSDDPQAMDKNFAAMFSCIDLVLGTFYMPTDRLPDTTGVYETEKATHPKDFRGQLLYPLTKR